MMSAFAFTYKKGTFSCVCGKVCVGKAIGRSCNKMIIIIFYDYRRGVIVPGNNIRLFSSFVYEPADFTVTIE